MKLKPLIAEKAKDRQRKGGKEKVVHNCAQAPKTRDELATIAGVSHGTIDKVETIRAELALKLKPLIAEKAKEKEREGGRRKGKQNSANPVNTREELAEVAGVSHDMQSGWSRSTPARPTPATRLEIVLISHPPHQSPA